MANYQSTKRLETEIDGLRNTRGGGLLQALRNAKQRKLEKELGAINENNDNLRTQELAMLLKGDRTGRVGDSYVARRADQFTPRHPELIEALRKQTSGEGMPSNVQEWKYFDSLPDPDQERYLTMRRGTPPINLGDRFEVPSQTSPGESLGQYQVGLPPQATPEVQGAQEAARQAAVTQAIPQRVATQTAAERQAQLPQAQERLASQQRQSTMVDGFIDEAISAASNWTTGIGGATLSGIPGTPAHDLSKIVDTIEANIGFDKLNQMRQQSPTGGALGSVTERELALLSSTLGSLKQSQSKEQFISNLEKVREQVRQIVHGAETQFQNTYGGQSENLIQDADAILRQAGFIE